MSKGIPIGLVIVAIIIAALWASSAKAEPAPAPPAPRVTKTLEIDANIYSPTFGEPIDSLAGGN